MDVVVLPDPSRLGLFVAAALVLLLTPGPAVLYIVTRSLDQGRRAGFVSVLGAHAGALVHVAAAAAGLSGRGLPPRRALRADGRHRRPVAARAPRGRAHAALDSRHDVHRPGAGDGILGEQSEVAAADAQ